MYLYINCTKITVTEKLRLGRTSGDHGVQLACSEQAQPNLNALSHVQTGSEFLQGFCYVYMDFPGFQFVSVSCYVDIGHHSVESGSVIFTPSLPVLIYIGKFSP